MGPFSRMAELHRKTFLALLREAGVEVELRLPLLPAPATSAKDRVFGTPVREMQPGESRLLQVLWSNDYLRPEMVEHGNIADAVATLAHNKQGLPLDAVLRLSLADVLLDPAAPQGMTLFDTARDLVYQGQTFQILSTKRTGLPPLGPYILWVGLHRVGGGR